MPTVTIRALPAAPVAVQRCHALVAERLGAALDRDPRGVWCQWVAVEAMHVGPEPRGNDDQCVVVTVRARAGRPDARVAAGLLATAEAVAEALEMAVEDVWVHWVEVETGRLFAGGAVR